MVIANADTSTAVGEEMISSDTQGLASAASMWTASGVVVFRWVFLSLHREGSAKCVHVVFLVAGWSWDKDNSLIQRIGSVATAV